MKLLSIMLGMFVSVAFLVAFVLPKEKGSRSANHFTRAEIQRGAYLVNTIGGCNDCHTPRIMTPKGPVPDFKRMLSGAPADEKVPEIPKGTLGPNGWGFLGTGDGTIFAGPWGVSFAANLTPDSATGIGDWTEKTFVDAMRKGQYWGSGRPLLPPMPWQEIGRMSNNDLRDIYAYLRSIRPVHNMVHDPIPPAQTVHH